MSKKGLGWELHLIFSSWMVVLLYFTIGYTLPISFYVDVDHVKTHDVCSGSNIIDVTAKRTSRWTMAGTTYAELVKYEGNKIYETTHRRGTRANPVDWTYEYNTYEVSYGTSWNAPINDTGVYSIRSWNTINPLPFIYREDYIDEREANRFNVIVCET